MRAQPRLWWTFAITSLALFAFTLDRLVVAIALPAIRTDLGAQAAGLEWTVNAYTLSFAVLLLTGGALGDRFGRRRMFTIGVLMGLGSRRLAESHGPRRKLDLAGVVLGSAGLFGMVWAVIRVGDVGWASTEVLLTLGGGVLLLVLFVTWEMRTPTPMLPMRFFRNRVFAAAAPASLMMYSAMFGALFLITQLLQDGLGATPLQAGLRTLPMAVMPMLLTPAGGVIVDRIGFRPLMICGLAMEAIALGWLAAVVTPTVSYGLLVPPLVLAATALPTRPSGAAARGLTDRPDRCENDARDAAPAGAAGRAADARYGRRTRRHGAGVGHPGARRGRYRQDQPRARLPDRDGWPG
jgi:MFS family permease